MRIFGENIKLSRIAEVPQAQFQTRLILNLPEKPDEGTPSVNDTTDREFASESMKFGRASPHILQMIWESYPAKVPVRVLKLDIPDAYNHSTLQPSQVGAFTYAVPL